MIIPTTRTIITANIIIVGGVKIEIKKQIQEHNQSDVNNSSDDEKIELTGNDENNHNRQIVAA